MTSEKDTLKNELQGRRALRKSLVEGSDFVPLSPIDGRYRAQTAPLVDYLSEAALNRERIYVEVQWVIALSQGVPRAGFDAERLRVPAVPGLPTLNAQQTDALHSIVTNFDAQAIKQLGELEAKTHHDVKAIEYYITSQLAQSAAFTEAESQKIAKAVHIFCTSEDINNLAYALCIKGAVQEVWLPRLEQFTEVLAQIAREHARTPMLAKTHGQPATPVTLGKELAVFVHRLQRQIARLKAVEYLGKINGATGTFGAHTVSVPTTDWRAFSKYFVEQVLGLTHNPLTTQIESHDWQVELYSITAHICGILHNIATDIWLYISNEVFIQIPVEGATGSSTMPHKINPIKFENAEANLEIADALFTRLSKTLVTSRLQRDLTDSSTQRNVAVAFAHSLIALDNLIGGVQKLKVNTEHLLAELSENPAVLGEAIQSAMRAAGIAGVEGMDNPYERLKDFTRGQKITLEAMQEFVQNVGLPDDVVERLLNLRPEQYLGLSAELTYDHLENTPEKRAREASS
jgi:adenylosuccinate lyase